ncbi:dihydroorotate dehydrogenase-like protein [Tautonia sp. JC769]|uniref:dihydroorotate dehydrogenase-like protein n=1 Tax=Tautonia sp. JC769 TaxID=3232135 RepID=UPI0034582505
MSVDLRTSYLGMELAHPVVVSACSLAFDPANLKRMEDAGASAIVLPSLFEEQIVHDQMAVHEFYEFTSEKFPEALSVFPEMEDYNTGPEAYLRLVEQAKRSLSVPVIGSLNGTSAGGWTRYAHLIQDAGADALELNIYHLVTDPLIDARAAEARYLELVAEVRKAVSIPLAVKLGPFFSALPHMATRLVDAGADGLVLFNRFYQPDIDLQTLRVVSRLVLSTSDEVRLPMRWIAILSGRVKASLAATTGVHTPEDVLKLLLAGADVTMVASALYSHGIDHLRVLVEGVRAWLEEHEYTSVAQMKGSVSQANAPDPEAFERANYIRTLVDFTGSESTR